MKTESMELLRELGNIPFQYKRDINYINNRCDELSQTYKYHTNFINNYFLKNKKVYFEDNSSNYSAIPQDFRRNSFLEN